MQQSFYLSKDFQYFFHSCLSQHSVLMHVHACRSEHCVFCPPVWWHLDAVTSAAGPQLSFQPPRLQRIDMFQLVSAAWSDSLCVIVVLYWLRTQRACCWLFIWSFQSPVLKTQTITISDVTNSLRGTVTYKDVPLVHTETKTITYESAQVRGVLGTAHLINY